MAGPIRIAILANASKARAEIDGVAGSARRLGRAGSTGAGGFKSLIGAFGALAAARGAFNFLKDGITSLGRIERLNAQTANVIQSTGGVARVSAKHIENLTGKLENQTATEAESIQTGANMLATFTNIRNGVGKSNKVYDQSVRAITDVSRALDKTGGANIDTAKTATQLGKALNDPVKGITALTKIGVSFSDKQKARIKGFVDEGKTMKAQKVILKELNKEFGGSGKAFAATQAGRIELAKHAFGTLQETIAAGLLPALSKGATAFTGFVQDMQSGTGAGGKIASILGKVGSVLGTVFGFLVKHKETVLTFIGVLGGLALAFAAVNAVLAINPITLIVVAIAAVVTGLIMAYKHSETFRDVVDTLGKAVKTDFELIGRAIRAVYNNVIQPVLKFFANAVAKVIDLFAAMFRGLSKVPGFGWAKNAADALDAAGRAAQGLADHIDKIPKHPKVTITPQLGSTNAIEHALTVLARDRVSHLKTVFDGYVGNPGKKAPTVNPNSPLPGADQRSAATERQTDATTARVIKKSKKAAAQLVAIAKASAEKFQAYRDDLAAKMDEAAAYAKGITDSFTDFGNITGLLDDNLPLAMEGTGNAIVDSLKRRVDQAQQFANLIKTLTAQGLNQTTIQQLLAAGPAAGLATAQALASGGSQALAQVNDLTAQLQAAGTSLGVSTSQTMYGAGIAVAQGLVNGIASQEALLVGVATKMGKKVAKAVKDALGIKSPSRVFRYEIGKQVVAGLRLGLSDGSRPVSRAGEVLASRLTAGFGSPELSAAAIGTSSSSASSATLRVVLTAQQLSSMQRGKEIALDLQAFRDAGGRVVLAS